MVKKIIMLVVGFTIAMGIAACQEKEQDKDQPSDGANGTVETTQAVESSAPQAADVSSPEATDVSSEPMAPQEPEVQVTVDETTNGSQPDVSVQQPAADATDLSAPVVQDATMSVPGAKAPDAGASSN